MLCMDGRHVLMYRQIQQFQVLVVILVELEMVLVWQVLWLDNLWGKKGKCQIFTNARSETYYLAIPKAVQL